MFGSLSRSLEEWDRDITINNLCNIMFGSLSRSLEELDRDITINNLCNILLY